jgi:hypothetical protein
MQILFSFLFLLVHWVQCTVRIKLYLLVRIVMANLEHLVGDMPWLHGVLMDLPDLLPVKGLNTTWYAWDDVFESSREQKLPEKRSLLHIAASMQAVKCVQTLLEERGADPRLASPSDGKTALHLACSCRPSMSSARVIAMLVQHGADREALDFDGRAPGAALEDMRRCDSAHGPCHVTCASNQTVGQVLTPLHVLEELDGVDFNSSTFMMYHYKSEKCPHMNCLHDVQSCPYVHPGEKARRNPATYKPIPCPHFRKGKCHAGDACPLAHGVFEAWLHPGKYRTQLCTQGTSCTRDLCFFAHTMEELREPLCCDAGSHTNSPRAQIPTMDNGDRIAALQASADEREKARRATAVADAVSALKALVASRSIEKAMGIPDSLAKVKSKMDARSVLSISTSGSSASLGSESY